MFKGGRLFLSAKVARKLTCERSVVKPELIIPRDQRQKLQSGRFVLRPEERNKSLSSRSGTFSNAKFLAGSFKEEGSRFNSAGQQSGQRTYRLFKARVVNVSFFDFTI